MKKKNIFNYFNKNIPAPSLCEWVSIRRHSLVNKYLLDLNKIHIAKKRSLAVFSFDYIGTQIALNGIYEKEELELLFDWLKSIDIDLKDSIAIDIGANIGNHSLYFSDFFNTVYSFEPNSQVFKLLQLNAKLVKNIHCFNFGLSSHASTSHLEIADLDNCGSANISNISTTKTISIELKTLDESISTINLINSKIKLIKIDVEGHEYKVLKGGEKTIMSAMPIIIFEQSATEFCNGSSPSIDLLKSFGYKKFGLIEEFPQLDTNFPKIIQNFIRRISKFFYGSSIRINGVQNFQPKFYSFVIAIPDWLLDINSQ